MSRKGWVCDRCGKPGSKAGQLDPWDTFPEKPKLRRVRPPWQLCVKCWDDFLKWAEPDEEDSQT